MEYNEISQQHFIEYCREKLPKTDAVRKLIDKFQENYAKEYAIWWYTSEGFIYHMLNKALRNWEGEVLILMGFFIADLYRQIERLHKEQIKTCHKSELIVYRGQRLLNSHFQQLARAVGGLMSFNSFLSTSIDREGPQTISISTGDATDACGILMIISFSVNQKDVNFANIKDYSAFPEEEEILFSMHTVFRITAIQKIYPEKHIYEVHLLCIDYQELLSCPTNSAQSQFHLLMIEPIIGLSHILFLTNQSHAIALLMRGEAAKKFTNLKHKRKSSVVQLSMRVLMLINANEPISQQTLDTFIADVEEFLSTHRSTSHPFYVYIGMIYSQQQKYREAVKYLNRALELAQKTLPSHDPKIKAICDTIVKIYYAMGQYSEALKFHESILGSRQNPGPSNHPEYVVEFPNNIEKADHNMEKESQTFALITKQPDDPNTTLPDQLHSAEAYLNISNKYYSKGQYSEALKFGNKGWNIYKKIFPADHSLLAKFYMNIGSIHIPMGAYAQALTFYSKASDIFEKSLPVDYSNLAMCYRNTGTVYVHIGQYSQAIICFNKAIDIYKKILPVDHPEIARSYINIGALYLQMGECSQVLTFSYKALDILEKNRPGDDRDFAITFNNIGAAHYQLEQYPQSLTFHNKALDICKQILSADHPDLGLTYVNIGNTHHQMRQNSQAIIYHNRALEIFQKSLPPDHSNLARLYVSIGMVYCHIKQFSQSLPFYNKALDIFQKTLPADHIDLARVYRDIGAAHGSLGESLQALQFYNKAIGIFQKTLPVDHIDLGRSYFGIGNIYYKTSEYFQALTVCNQALDIFMKTLPANHAIVSRCRQLIDLIQTAINDMN